jgi:hypothetical protein
MKISSCLSALTVAICLIGCSAAPVVTPVAISPKPPLAASKDGTLAGVPFRIQSEQIVRVYAWDLDKKEYKVVASYKQIGADLSRLYVLDVAGSDFASPSLHITQNADNTLKLVGVTSNASGSTANSVGTALSGIAKAQSDKATAQLTSDTAVATAQKNLRDALDAYSKLPTTASADVINAYQSAVAAARLQLDAACHSAAVSGTPCPPLP